MNGISTKSETPKAATNGASSKNTSTSKKDAFMTDSITPSIFDFHGNTVRIVMRNNEPWFVASDVCSALEYSNPSKAVADHLDDDEKMTLTTGYGHSGRAGGQRLQIVINESGLYALVLRSRKPEARKFAKWVTNEVLPSIRKTGSYTQESTQKNLDLFDGNADTLARAFHTASQAAAKLQESVFMELVKPSARVDGRMMISLRGGNPVIKFVDDQSYVLPMDKFAAAILDNIAVTPDVLASINAACVQRLKEMAATKTLAAAANAKRLHSEAVVRANRPVVA